MVVASRHLDVWPVDRQLSAGVARQRRGRGASADDAVLDQVGSPNNAVVGVDADGAPTQAGTYLGSSDIEGFSTIPESGSSGVPFAFPSIPCSMTPHRLNELLAMRKLAADSFVVLTHDGNSGRVVRAQPIVRLRCRNTRSSDTTKGVNSYRQQEGGHGSLNPLRSVQQLSYRMN